MLQSFPLAFQPLDTISPFELLGFWNQLCLSEATPSSDLSPVNLHGYAGSRKTEICQWESLLWLRVDGRLFPPLGDWGGSDWAEALAPFSGMTIHRVPESLLGRWEKAGVPLSVKEDRDHFEYLYRIEALRLLHGNRYHRKRNLANRFHREQDFSFSFGEVASLPAILDMQQDWCTWKDCAGTPSLAEEDDAIRRILQERERFPGLVWGVMRAGEETAGFGIGERVGAGYLILHFEKADIRFTGVYQALNRAFLQAVADVSGDGLVNREQDLGDPGLRKAKKSYLPERMLVKYQVALKM